MAELTDESVMSFGKHKGTKLANVPASYLLWCYENENCNQELKDYIYDNLDLLQLELQEKQK